MSGRLEEIEHEAYRARQWVRENFAIDPDNAHAKIPAYDLLTLVEIARAARDVCDRNPAHLSALRAALARLDQPATTEQQT